MNLSSSGSFVTQPDRPCTRTRSAGVLSRSRILLLADFDLRHVSVLPSGPGAHSVNLDGVRAEEIKKSLAADVTAEIAHAQQFARRIKTLSGSVPGSFSFTPHQATLQPTGDTTDVVSVIKGVIDAARGALEHYGRVIKACDGVDYVTQDMIIGILADEQQHLREFEGYLKEYDVPVGR